MLFVERVAILSIGRRDEEENIYSSYVFFVLVYYFNCYFVLKDRKKDSYFHEFDQVYWYVYNREIREMYTTGHLSEKTIEKMISVKMDNDKVKDIFSEMEFKCVKVVLVGPYDLLILSKEDGETIGVQISKWNGEFRIIGQAGWYILSDSSKKALGEEIDRMKMTLKKSE